MGYDKNKYIYKLIPKETVAVYCAKILILCEKGRNQSKKVDIICDFGVVTEKSKEISDKVFDLLEEDGYHNYTC